MWYNLQHLTGGFKSSSDGSVSNRVGLWYNLQLKSPLAIERAYIKVSNRVGLWYNLQPEISGMIEYVSKFQTELVCGIICNLSLDAFKKVPKVSVSNRVGLWYNLQPFSPPSTTIQIEWFQTELVCGIICN